MVVYHVLADLAVLIHAAYVGFVVLGFALILPGVALGWRWVGDFRLRVAHLAAIGLVCIEAVVGAICPLTALENYLRQRGGAAGYPGDFVGYWAHELIFFDAPPWVFTICYLVFGALVAATFVLAPPHRSGRHAALTKDVSGRTA